jgi:hypothetical protein
VFTSSTYRIYVTHYLYCPFMAKVAVIIFVHYHVEIGEDIFNINYQVNF